MITRTLLAATAVLVLASPPTGAQEVEVATARIVDQAGSPQRGGGSLDAFTLQLPTDASCPGDSADEGYRVNSYMVPAAEAPEAVTYDGLGPTPKVHGRYEGFRQPLYDVGSAFFVSALTADADQPGAPGQILQPPLFDFGVYAPGDLPAGTYRVGIACTLLNEVARVWDAELRVVEDPTDEPAGIRWEAVGVVGDPADGGSGPGLPLTVALGAAVGGAALVLNRRRRAPARTRASREDA